MPRFHTKVDCVSSYTIGGTPGFALRFESRPLCVEWFLGGFLRALGLFLSPHEGPAFPPSRHRHRVRRRGRDRRHRRHCSPLDLPKPSRFWWTLAQRVLARIPERRSSLGARRPLRRHSPRRRARPVPIPRQRPAMVRRRVPAFADARFPMGPSPPRQSPLALLLHIAPSRVLR